MVKLRRFSWFGKTTPLARLEHIELYYSDISFISCWMLSFNQSDQTCVRTQVVWGHAEDGYEQFALLYLPMCDREDQVGNQCDPYLCFDPFGAVR